MKEQLLTCGIVGARGYVGRELIPMLDRHPHVDVVFFGSRKYNGQNVSNIIEGVQSKLQFEDISPSELKERGVNALILALPNGLAQPYLEESQKENEDIVVIDLSTDHRFHHEWTYGLTEHFRDDIRRSLHIANPGCYATGMQLAIRPVLELLDSKMSPTAFGVSGWSGAGEKPSIEEDKEKLKISHVLPYAFSGHIHEAETTRHLGRPVSFLPHMGNFFRGISLSITMKLEGDVTLEEIICRYETYYREESLIKISEETPTIKEVVETPYCMIGGFAVRENELRMVSVLDNLGKGAATQAVQNLNVVCGFEELTGIKV